MKTQILNIPLNRVEGDLALDIEVQDGIVTDAWSSGLMYRGFENMLVGRAALDGLVITPRICGICSSAHLLAAATALDKISGVTVPDNARRIRNLSLMVENIQSDMRQSFLLFAPDLVHPFYHDQPWYAEAVRRYTPLRGQLAVETIRETKKILEIIAIFGGQWPHSSFMVPGGVVSQPASGALMQCQYLLDGYKRWYEERILGCTIERWNEIQNSSDLETWSNSEQHEASEVGFFLRIARQLGWDHIGVGGENFLSVGSLNLPQETAVRPFTANCVQLIPGGFAVGRNIEGFEQLNVTEHTAHSWFNGEPGGQHPFTGTTQPYASGRENRRYSWAKAPRYRDLPAETGPLAERIISGDALFTDLLREQGASVMLRQLARLTRPAQLLPAMEIWLKELLTHPGAHYQEPAKLEDGEGVGLVQAARGALGHWVRIKDGKITQYQIITPTAWNGSPRDSSDTRGPWEQALIGAPVRDPENPLEVGHIVRSFDPCLVCTVHTFDRAPSQTYKFSL
jgi:Ni,Fe-hydrogenase I large subunit